MFKKFKYYLKRKLAEFIYSEINIMIAKDVEEAFGR
jgi:hypothetical protein